MSKPNNSGVLEERRKLFELRDDLNSEIVPKGLLLMGIPGCGKSLAVKAIASRRTQPRGPDASRRRRRRRPMRPRPPPAAALS